MLDDFKTALDGLKEYKLERISSFLNDGARGDFMNADQAYTKKNEQQQSGPMKHTSSHLEARDWTKDEHPGPIDLERAFRTDSSEPG